MRFLLRVPLSRPVLGHVPQRSNPAFLELDFPAVTVRPPINRPAFVRGASPTRPRADVARSGANPDTGRPLGFAICVLAALTILTAVAGCLSVPHQIVACPMTYSEQEKEILTIVPKGTRREEALRRLAAAGIEGDPGISRRVYYCDLWNRQNGERWHLNVALLFDESDCLYKTQWGQADTAQLPKESETPVKHAATKPNELGPAAASLPAVNPPSTKLRSSTGFSGAAVTR